MRAAPTLGAVLLTQWCLVCVASRTLSYGPTEAPDNSADYLQAYNNALAQLNQYWRYDTSLMCATAAVSGRMNKTATLTDMPWKLWSKARRRTLPKYVPVYDLPTIWVSLTYKIIFIRQQKSSSSSLLEALKGLLCKDPANCERDELSNNYHGVTNGLWNEFFVFTWVRNPITRMLSGYNMMCEKFLYVRAPGSDVPGEHCCVPFQDFSADPYVLVTACDSNRCCPWNPYTTQDWDFNFISGHINDQAHKVFTADGRSMVDFIGRTEHFDADWSELWQHINRHLGLNFVPNPAPISNPAGERAVKEGTYVECLGRTVPLIDERSMGNIARQFAMDMLQFGYFAIPMQAA